MEIAELEDIQNKIINDEINLEVAKELIYSTKAIKSRHTKKWKDIRKVMLKNECKQCGSKEALTMQHTWHPERYGDIKYRFSQKYGELLNKEYELSGVANYYEAIEYFNENYIQEECLCCPKCKKEYKYKAYPYCKKCNNLI